MWDIKVWEKPRDNLEGLGPPLEEPAPPARKGVGIPAWGGGCQSRAGSLSPGHLCCPPVQWSTAVPTPQEKVTLGVLALPSGEGHASVLEAACKGSCEELRCVPTPPPQCDPQGLRTWLH